MVSRLDSPADGPAGECPRSFSSTVYL